MPELSFNIQCTNAIQYVWHFFVLNMKAIYVLLALGNPYQIFIHRNSLLIVTKNSNNNELFFIPEIIYCNNVRIESL